MASILVLYMNEHLGYSELDARAAYHWFFMASYLTPLLGGWLADRYLGRYRTILWVSLAYVAGHAVLALQRCWRRSGRRGRRRSWRWAGAGGQHEHHYKRQQHESFQHLPLLVNRQSQLIVEMRWLVAIELIV